MGKENLNYKLMKRYPNKYNLTIEKIKHLKVLDWDKLKKNTVLNTNHGGDPFYCYSAGSNLEDQPYDDREEFWIGFEETCGTINVYFIANYLCSGYTVDSFYKSDSIYNELDMNVQANALKWLNQMIDDRILGF